MTPPTKVRPILLQDINATADALALAFTGDPLIGFLFGPGWETQSHARSFFHILLSVRVALGMPAFCADHDGTIIGGVMGYDTTRPQWQAAHAARWQALLDAVEGLAQRLAAYEHLADAFQPTAPHYYLGVIGVRPDAQGTGVGKALLERFCAASRADPASSGVYLETASSDSLAFYRWNGFVQRGQGTLGVATPLWCVFQPTAQGARD